MRLPYELFLALRYLRYHRGQTFLSIISFFSVAGVTVGTASLVIALSLNAGFVEDVRERIHSGSAHLTVLNVQEPGLFDGAGAVVDQVESVDGVAAAAPVLYTPALITFEAAGAHGFVELHGIDPTGHSRVILGEPAAGEETFGRLSQPTESGREGILLGQDLASKIDAYRGDLVRVLVPKITLSPWGGQPRSRVFEVVGTYRSDHFQEDSIRAYVAIDAARAMLRASEGSSWVEVRLDDLRQLQPMKESLRGSLSPTWLVVDLIEQNRDILRALRTEKLILFLAIGLIVVVASLNIISTLILTVTDKVKEIGTLSALGAKPAGIAKVFILQGAVIGLVGTILGLLLGVAVCWGLDKYRLIPLNPEVYYLTHIPFTTQPVDVAAVGAAALVIALLATIYPAIKAARLDPVEAIRHE